MANPTDGSWIGVFGSLGAWIPTTTAAPLTYPPEIPKLVVSGSSNYYPNNLPPAFVWAANTADPRGLLYPDGSGKRIASCVSGGSSNWLKVTVPNPDKKALIATFYFCDWDSSLRAQLIEQLDAGGNVVGTGITIRNFHGGLYWQVPIFDTTSFRFTKQAGSNCIVNAIFLDLAGPPPDTVSPAMISPYVDASGALLGVPFSEPVNGSAGFAINGQVADMPITLGTGVPNADKTLLAFPIDRDRPIFKGEVISLTYTAGDVKDLSGNPLADLSMPSIDNHSTVAAPVWQVVAQATIAQNNDAGVRTRQVVEMLTWEPGAP